MVASGADVPVEPPPPPTPFERSGTRRRRRRRAAAGLVLVAAAALAVARLVDPAGSTAAPDGPSQPAPVVEDAAMLGLLRAIDRAESAMLGFGDASRAALEAGPSREAGLAGVGIAAGEALGDLEAEREGLAVGLAAPAAEEVRTAYLPHLDAWIAYLAAVAVDPEELFAGSADPAILRINATARIFARALAAALDAGVGPEARELGLGILEQGFPAQDDADL